MKALAAILVATALSCSALAQTPPHSVDLKWTKSADDNGTNATYNAYRTNQLCGALPLQFAPLASGIAGTSYTDSTVTIGYYCYEVTVTINGAESPNSNTAEARVLPLAPSALTAIPK